VVVVHVQAHPLAGELAADGAAAVLELEQFVKFIRSKAELSLQMTLAVGDLFLTGFEVCLLGGAVPLRVLSLPLAGSCPVTLGISCSSERFGSQIADLAVVAVAVTGPRCLIEVNEGF
jgi:hypothetical protein